MITIMYLPRSGYECMKSLTVNGHKYSSPSILRLYISYKTTFFKKNYCEVIFKWILIIFAPEEAEIFKDYLFILV
jgi:hypothetical protein